MSKVIIVTGASRGLGYAIARALLKASHKVFLVARSVDELAGLKAEYGDAVGYISADLSDLKVGNRLFRCYLYTLYLGTW